MRDEGSGMSGEGRPNRDAPMFVMLIGFSSTVGCGQVSVEPRQHDGFLCCWGMRRARRDALCQALAREGSNAEQHDDRTQHGAHMADPAHAQRTGASEEMYERRAADRAGNSEG